MTLTLVCFAHAGGHGALFRGWAALLPASVTIRTVTLPGRGTARNGAPITAWDALLDYVDAQLVDVRTGEGAFAVFGHSMGALVGFEWLQRLAQRTGRQATWLGVSGTVWPPLREPEDGWLTASTESVVARLRARGGTPAALLDDPSFVELLVPALRADFHLCGRHPVECLARWQGPLTCPLTVFVGSDDPATQDQGALQCWQRGTTEPWTLRRFDGGHFFIETDAASVLAEVRGALEAAVAQPG